VSAPRSVLGFVRITSFGGAAFCKVHSARDEIRFVYFLLRPKRAMWALSLFSDFLNLSEGTLGVSPKALIELPARSGQQTTVWAKSLLSLGLVGSSSPSSLRGPTTPLSSGGFISSG